MSLVDLQVNGYAGVDFNQDELAAGDLHRACLGLRHDHIGSALATVITEDLDRMSRRIARLAELRAADPLVGEVIAGLHIEGPFLNPEPGFAGAHPIDAIRPAEVDAMKRLVDAGDGLVRMVTLAPEYDSGLATTRWLTERGVVVSAGHCDPTRDQLLAGIDAGLSGFTHLGNGCPGELPRHDNIVQRALSLADRLTLCFIADGVHVPFFALRNYLSAAGVENCVVVSDAIAPAGLGPGRFTLSRWELDIGDDLIARSSAGGHLVGSAVGLWMAADRLAGQVGLTAEQIRALTRDNPARLIQRDGWET